MTTPPFADALIADLDDRALTALTAKLGPYLYDGAADAPLPTPAEAARRNGVHPQTLTRAAASGRVAGAERVDGAGRFRADQLALAPPASSTPASPPPAGPRSASRGAAGHQRVCAACGPASTGLRRDARICSGACRAALSRLRRDEPARRFWTAYVRIAMPTAHRGAHANGREDHCDLRRGRVGAPSCGRA